MSRIEHNPPAFPVERYARFPGMTLRDWFAGQALVGLLHPGYEANSTDAPEQAYRLADLMLAERQKDADA